MEANQQVPLCINCRHFDDSAAADKEAPIYPTCRHPRSLHVDSDSAVWGPVALSFYYGAPAMRDHICGPLGKLFEAKEKHYDQDYAHADACAKAGVSERGPSR